MTARTPEDDFRPAGNGEADPRRDPRWILVERAAHTPVSTPPDLVERVLTSVHATRGQALAAPVVFEQDRGEVRIAERAVVGLARGRSDEVAQDLGGIRISRVAWDAEGVTVRTTVRYGVAAAEVAERLRASVTEHLAAQLGWAAPAVHVHVADVY